MKRPHVVWRYMAVMLTLSGASLCAFAGEIRQGQPCFREAAQRYRLDERLLRAIAKVESNFDATAIHRNTNGSRDIGLMQINSSHLPRLGDHGISESTLLTDPCTNVMAGAWILASNVRHFGPTWRAAGAYNAGTSPHREGGRLSYARRIKREFDAVARRDEPMASSISLSSPPAVASRMQVLQ